ncbi:hypothetical protein FKP32DRAFT_61923 [Trametes sanguinea]|nr:hypothetical protein FKP32DRAFT_61923 [Trametes sanguinea]
MIVGSGRREVATSPGQGHAPQSSITGASLGNCSRGSPSAARMGARNAFCIFGLCVGSLGSHPFTASIFYWRRKRMRFSSRRVSETRQGRAKPSSPKRMRAASMLRPFDCSADDSCLNIRHISHCFGPRRPRLAGRDSRSRFEEGEAAECMSLPWAWYPLGRTTRRHCRTWFRRRTCA